MNFAGVGASMMRTVMRNKNVEMLEQMMENARLNGVEFIACQMSMDVMGINAQELMEGVQIGGVAAYLERAEQANLNLFI